MATTAPAPLPGIDFGSLLADIPAGAWVAISSDGSKVLSYGSDIRAVIEQAKGDGEHDPIIMRVPECSSSLFM